MAITKSGTRVTVEADGSDGYDWAHPYFWQDIVDANDANGWGMTHQNGVYFVPFSIYIEADTHIYIYEVSPDMNITIVYCTPTPADDYYMFYTHAKAHVRIGHHIDYNDFHTVHFVVDEEAMSESTYRRMLISCEGWVRGVIFQNVYYQYLRGNSADERMELTNVINIESQFGINTNEFTDIKNVTHLGGYYGLQLAGVGSCDGLLSYGASIPLLCSGGTEYTFRNVKTQEAENEERDMMIRFSDAVERIVTVVDSEVSKSKIVFYNSGARSTCLSEARLKTTMGVYVTGANGDAVDGATVTVYGVDETELLNDVTDVNGELTGNEVLYYNQIRERIDDVDQDDVVNDYEPLYVTVEKTGYTTQTIRGITVTPGVPTDVRMTLLEPDVPVVVDGVEITDASTIGGSDGQIVVTASGGDGSYTYSIDGSNYQGSDTFTGLSAGTVTVYVKDGEDTVATLENVTVGEPVYSYQYGPELLGSVADESLAGVLDGETSLVGTIE